MRQIPIPLWIIIEEENRRKREEDFERQRPTLEIPMYPPEASQNWNPYPEKKEDNEAQRGEVIIPLW